jgi:hypothetical protein
MEPRDVDLERQRLPLARARRPVEARDASKAQSIYRKWHNQKLV